MMEFSRRTLEIIKNFSQINTNGLAFPVGDRIGSFAATAGNIVAFAKLDTPITEEFAIYDVAQFYSALTSFDSPVVTIDGLTIKIEDANERLGQFVIAVASPSIVKPPRDVAFPNDGNLLHFELTNQQVSRILKGVAIAPVPQIRVFAENSNVVCAGYDKHNPKINHFRFDIAPTFAKEKFSYLFSVESIIKLMKGLDYTVSIHERGIARFEAINDIGLTYYVATESK